MYLNVSEKWSSEKGRFLLIWISIMKFLKNHPQLLGISIILIANVTFVGNNYLVQLSELSAGEISLVRGALQVLVFSVLLKLSKSNKVMSDKKIPARNTLKKIFLVIFNGLMCSSMTFVFLFALTLMPISDLTVVSFSTAVFTCLLEPLILKKPFSVIAVFLSFIIGKYSVAIYVFMTLSFPSPRWSSRCSTKWTVQQWRQWGWGGVSSVLSWCCPGSVRIPGSCLD